MRRLAVLCASLLLLTGCGGLAEEGGTAGLAANQSQFYGKVTAAFGNDVILEIGTPREAASLPAEEAQALSAGEREGGPPDGDGMGPQGVPPSGDFAGGEWEDVPSDGPENEEKGSAGVSRRSAGIELELTGETRSLRIPVGTPVTRNLGQQTRKTTFTQIAADNVLLVTVQESEGEQVVVAVEIVQ